MPDGVVVRFPEDMSTGDINSYIYKSYPEEIRQENLAQGPGEELGAGILRGVDTTKALLTDALPALGYGIGEKLGVEGAKEGYERELQEFQKHTSESALKHPKTVQSYKDVSTLGEAGSYALGTTGEAAASMLTSLGSGFTANVAAKTYVKHLAKKSALELSEAQAKKIVTNSTVAGAVTGSMAQEAPSSYVSILETTGKNAPVAAVAAGALKSALEVLPAMKVLNDILTPKVAAEAVTGALAKRLGLGFFAKETGKIAGLEGVTEGAQEAIDILATKFVDENQDVFTRENLDAIIESTLAGALGGGGVGSVTSLAQVVTQPTIFTDEAIDTLFTEEDIGPSQSPLTGVKDSYNTVASASTVPEAGATNDIYNAEGRTQELEVTPEVSKDIAASLTNAQQATTIDQVYAPQQGQGQQQADPREFSSLVQEMRGKEQVEVDPVLDNTPITPFTVQAKVNPLSQDNTTIDFQEINGEVTPVADSVHDAEVVPTVLNNQLNSTELTHKGTVKRVGLSKALSNVLSGGSPTTAKPLDFMDAVESSFEERAVLPLTKKEAKVYNDVFKETAGAPLSGERQAFEQAVPSIQYDYKTNTLNFKPEDSANFLSFVESKGVPTGKGKTNTFSNKVAKAVKNSKLIESKRFSPLRGAKYRNLTHVSLSLTDPKLLSDPVSLEMAYHEAYHDLEDTFKVFTQSERNMLERDTPKLEKMIVDELGITPYDLDLFYSSKEGMAEMRSWVFGKWALDKVKSGGIHSKDLTLPKGVPTDIGKLFVKALDSLRTYNLELRKEGFSTYQDILAPSPNSDPSINPIEESVNVLKHARLQRISAGFANQTRNRNLGAEIKDAVKSVNGLGPLGFINNWYNSNAFFANHDPIGALIYGLEESKRDRSSTKHHNYNQLIREYQQAPRAVRMQINKLASQMRGSGQKAKLDAEGRLTFVRDGRTVRISDPDVGKQYTALQDGFRAVLTDYMGTIKNGAVQEFGLPSNFTFEDVTNLIGLLEQSKGNAHKITRLNNLKERMSEFVNLTQGRDYIPHMRFGQHGLTVRDKATGEQVYFATFEQGNFKKKYNKFQMEEIVKEVNEKYSDTTKYEIIGGNGKIGKLTVDNLHPFDINQASIAKDIDPSLFTLDMAAALLQGKNLDAKAYEAMKEELYNNILDKGFKRKFEKSKGIPGYSKDWDRVNHSYFTGAAHFLSGLESAKEASAIASAISKVTDEKRKAKYERTLEYIGSPQADLQAVRQVNFVWALGLNLMTAAMQTVTLGTATFSGMHQYSYNTPKNAQLITKWGGFGSKEFLSQFGRDSRITDGTVVLDFSDQRLSSLMKKGKLKRSEANFMTWLAQSGRLGATLVEESAGSRRYETRSKTGKAKDTLDSFVNAVGIPISLTEQLTRFTTAMSFYEMLEGSPAASRKAERILENNPKFKALQAHNQDKGFNELVALFSVDEAHAVFGKLGRPDVMKSWGGALILPFQTYPQQQIEFMVKMYNRGPSGKAALGMYLTTLWTVAGLLGLPGAELLKELYEALHKEVFDEEIELDYLIREAIYKGTGDANIAVAGTQGLLRGYGGIDVARRLGLAPSGQEILLNMTGIRGETTDLLGVQGSILTGTATAWKEWKLGGNSSRVLSHVTPVFASNLIKAEEMAESGVNTRKGKQLIHPEDVTRGMQLKRAAGVTDAKIASAREKVFYTQILERSDQPAYKIFSEKAKRALSKYYDAVRNGEKRKASQARMEYDKIRRDVVSWARDKGYPLDMSSFTSNVQAAAVDRSNPGESAVQRHKVRRTARDSYDQTEAILTPR